MITTFETLETDDLRKKAILDAWKGPEVQSAKWKTPSKTSSYRRWKLIGKDCPPSNWNMGVDPFFTNDLHLTSAFYHLFYQTAFAITDFIYVRQFDTVINSEITNKG